MLTILEAQQITQCEETTRGLRDNLLYNINSESMDCLVWEDALVIESHFQHQKARELILQEDLCLPFLRFQIATFIILFSSGIPFATILQHFLSFQK